MARYNEIYQRTWESSSFKSLSKPEPNAQTLWLYLLTGRVKTPLPGIYGIGLGALSDYLKWFPESLAKCFRELSENDMAYYDEEHSVIYLPSWDRWNKPQNPNVLKSWFTLLDNIPDCHYKLLYLQQLKSLCESLGESFIESFENHYGNDMPNPEPEPKPEPKPNPEPKENNGGKPPAHSDFENLFEEWWKLYPVKKEKQSCKLEYLKILKEQGKEFHNILLTAINEQIDYRKRADAENEMRKNDNKELIWLADWIYPIRWLKRRRWEDEIAEVPHLETTEEYFERRKREHLNEQI